MPETNLKAQLSSLIELQAIDSQIYALKNEKNLIPAELQAIESAFEEKKQRMAGLEKQLLDVQKQKKETEGDLAAREEATKKLQSQLFSLKTNKEYQTMLQQISDSKADGSVIEDKILVLFDSMDKLKNDVEREKKALAEEEKKSNEEKKKVNDRIKEIDDKLAQMDAQRGRISPGIDPEILAQYERILQNREGLAIVAVKNNTCLGCNMFVQAQIINLVKMYEHIITCEVCNRILFVDE